MKKAVVALLLVSVLVNGFLIGSAKTKKENYINTESEEFVNNYVDMREVVDIQSTENSVTIILEDGNCYYWER